MHSLIYHITIYAKVISHITEIYHAPALEDAFRSQLEATPTGSGSSENGFKSTFDTRSSPREGTQNAYVALRMQYATALAAADAK